MNIFGKRDQDEVSVPEIEVHGDEVRVQPNEGQQGQADEREPQKNDRNYRLPKTKWF